MNHDMNSTEDVRRPSLAVCVVTRARAAGLTRALEGIAKQRMSSDECAEIRIIVVDNDSNLSAQAVCDRLRPNYQWKLDYAVEPITGIPCARNRAIEMAILTADLMVFLDDDEVPTGAWLSELVRVWREYSADVVLGPVGHYFPEPVPRWIERGSFFERQPQPTGTICTVGWSGNVLMSTQMLRESGLRFDENYRLTGGTDVMFFRRVYQAGYRMIWADEALATEWIPKYRATLRWLATRNFRIGALDARNLGLWFRLRASIMGLVRIIVGTGCAIVLFPVGKHHSAKAIRWASYGLGLLYGSAGKRFDEYRTVRDV